MVSDDDSDNSSEPDHRNSTGKLRGSVKKRRRKTGLELSLKDKKRKAIDNRIDATKLEQNQPGGVSGGTYLFLWILGVLRTHCQLIGLNVHLCCC